MKDVLHSIQIYSATARGEEKAHRRREDLQLIEAGKAAEVQAANRLISNPQDWRLEIGEDVAHE